MGTWGPESFENDSAMDWLDDLVQLDHDSFNFIISTLERSISSEMIYYGDRFADTYNIDTAIAAAEIVAALKGRPHKNLTKTIGEWVNNHRNYGNQYMIDLAIAAVTRALEVQEYRELWANPAIYDQWREVVSDLKIRLQA